MSAAEYVYGYRRDGFMRWTVFRYWSAGRPVEDVMLCRTEFGAVWLKTRLNMFIIRRLHSKPRSVGRHRPMRAFAAALVAALAVFTIIWTFCQIVVALAGQR